MIKRVERVVIAEGPVEAVDKWITGLHNKRPGESRTYEGGITITCKDHKEFYILSEEELKERDG